MILNVTREWILFAGVVISAGPTNIFSLEDIPAL